MQTNLTAILPTDAESAGTAHADPDPELTASGLLALTNSLGSSVLGGQRDADAALRILTYLDRLFVAS